MDDDYCYRKVVLRTEAERWFLFDGKEADRGNGPWELGVSFEVTDIEIRDSFQGDAAKDAVTEDELIVANLVPARFDPKVFVVFGTDQPLSDIRLLIRAVGENQKESCIAEGHEGWSHNKPVGKTTPYTLSFNLCIKESRFAHYVELVRSKTIDAAYLSVGQVEGFYSDSLLRSLRWFETDQIMVLPHGKRHLVEIPDDCAIEPLRLGNVGNFELSLTTELKLIVLSEQKIGDEQKPEKQAQIVAFSDPETLGLLKSLRLAAWVIAAIIGLILIFRR